MRVPSTTAFGHFVHFRPREDLFAASGSELIQIATDCAVTSIPDHVACVEVLSVGHLVRNVVPGQQVFLDFFDVAQGLCVDGGDVYVANDHCLKAEFRDGRVYPLPGYCLVKPAPDRMSVALTGTDRILVPPYVLTEGIPGGRTSGGEAQSHVLYDEVVAVGTPLPDDEGLNSRERHYLAQVVQLREALHSLSPGHPLARAPLPRPVEVGDLVAYCSAWRTPIRVRGEFLGIVPTANLLGAIDDRGMLDQAVRDGRAGRLVLAR